MYTATSNVKSKKLIQSAVSKSSKASLPSTQKPIPSETRVSSTKDIGNQVWLATLYDNWESIQSSNRDVALLKGLKLYLRIDKNKIVKSIKPDPDSEVLCKLELMSKDEMVTKAMRLNKLSPVDTQVVHTKAAIMFEPKKGGRQQETISILSQVASFSPDHSELKHSRKEELSGVPVYLLMSEKIIQTPTLMTQLSKEHGTQHDIIMADFLIKLYK